jgi:hypothetical protein
VDERHPDAIFTDSVKLVKCSDSASQKWYHTFKDSQLRNVRTGQCLDIVDRLDGDDDQAPIKIQVSP